MTTYLMAILLTSFVVSACVIAGLIRIDVDQKRYQALVAEAERLSLAARSQTAKLAAGLLVDEEYGSVNLYLQTFKEREGLSDARVLPANVPAPDAGCTPGTAEGEFTCIDEAANSVRVRVPIVAGGQRLGVYEKVRKLADESKRGVFSDTLWWLGFGYLFNFVLIAVLFWAFVIRGLRRAIVKLSSTVGPESEGGGGVRVESTISELDILGREINKMIRRKVAIERDAARDAAIARTTQMLAHDVRKPFSMLRAGLSMLDRAKDRASMDAILSRLGPELDRATSSVEGLLADIMEIGVPASGTLIREPVDPSALIEAAVEEALHAFPRAAFTIDYDLRHAHLVNVHAQRVARIFSNIVTNAFQAMNFKGHVWFGTREVGGFVEFRIGNTGSTIPRENLPKLFDAFFTSGKRGGTGLGLAIAQKIVFAHGGKIWCESHGAPQHPQGVVEFKFTLPIAAGHRSTSLEPTQALSAVAAAAQGTQVMDDGEAALEAEIIAATRALGRPLRVLVVDDEAVYQRAFAADLIGLEASAAVAAIDDVNAAVDLCQAKAFDLVVADIEMGPASPDGFELVRNLRGRLASRAVICVYSNRVVGSDRRTALDAGADCFLSKPVNRAQVLELVLQAAQKVARPQVEVALVEDNAFTRDAWAEILGDEAIVHQFDSPDEFADRIERQPRFLASLSLVVTDYLFDNSSLCGFDVGQMVKSRRPELPVLLSSESSFTLSEVPAHIDRVIAKEPTTLGALQKRL